MITPQSVSLETKKIDQLVRKVEKLEKQLAEAQSRDYKVLWQTFLKEASLLKDDLISLGRIVYRSGQTLRTQLERRPLND
jgi:hypothetical protein